MTVDTSAEVVERLAASLARAMLYDGGGELSDLPEEAAATLRALAADNADLRALVLAQREQAEEGAAANAALAAERDAARRAAAAQADTMGVQMRAVEAERDAARAEVARLREALKKALPVLDEAYRWHRDMQSHIGKTLDAHTALAAARAALAADPQP